MTNSLKKNTDLLIVGGGIFGASIAYYFKRDNPDKEVVVYERNEMCSGNTSLAAALLSRVRTNQASIPLAVETFRVIKELEEITNDRLPVHYTGAIHLAVKPEKVIQVEEMMKVASENNIEWESITDSHANKMVPWLNASKAEKIFYVPGEAYTDAYLLGKAFVNAAKALGVIFKRNTEVTDLIKSNQNVIGISTKSGIHEAEKTILAAGVWSTYLAYKIGLGLPMAPIRSQYWITEPSETLFLPASPTVIIPDASFYARPQGNSLLFGIREINQMYCDLRILPEKITEYKFSTDNGWQDLIESFKKIVPFFNQFGNTGIKDYIAGFSAYTPDNMLIAGECREIRGLIIAGGCVGSGISVAGGIGLGIAHLAAGKANPFDFSQFRVDRFGTYDPYKRENILRCAEARSKKTCG